MNTPAVLRPPVPIVALFPSVALFKEDSPRRIDRLIDFFGDERAPAAASLELRKLG